MDITKIESLLTATYRKEEYPVCLYQTAQWGRTLPLKGLTVLDATPVFRNTLVKHLALIASGARLMVGISPLLPSSPEIIELLRTIGIPLFRPDEEPVEPDLILDCAGVFSSWKPRIGFVELTRSGVDKYGNSDKPVFMADNGHIKRIETCLGTGESYFRAMNQLGYKEWKGRKMVLFGCGKVGSGILIYANQMGVEVTVVTELSGITQQAKKMAARIIDYRDSVAVGQAVSEAYAVVTATGVVHALEGNCPADALIYSSALLANMGVEDEYGPSIPAERVLMRKRALNFILDEPTHMKYLDATMALHNEGALYLATHPEAKGVLSPPHEMEEELLRVCRLNGCINDKLDLLLER